MNNTKLRDKIAIEAMKAIIAKTQRYDSDEVGISFVDNLAKAIASGAYTYADAMLAERQK